MARPPLGVGSRQRSSLAQPARLSVQTSRWGLCRPRVEPTWGSPRRLGSIELPSPTQSLHRGWFVIGGSAGRGSRRFSLPDGQSLWLTCQRDAGGARSAHPLKLGVAVS